jgi:hypothetical protein
MLIFRMGVIKNSTSAFPFLISKYIEWVISVTAPLRDSRYNQNIITTWNHSMLQRENMGDTEKAKHPRLWISYPWMNREERDFAYLVSQLKDLNIEAAYDSLQLQPNMHLWERTIQRLRGIGFDGWLYILTHQCFTRRTCIDELTVAIDRAQQHMGSSFPMVGLMYGISAQQVPLTLRARPCLSLADPNWKQQISNIIKYSAPQFEKGAAGDAMRFNWMIHPNYCGDPSMTAVEVSLKGGSIPYWRFAIPKSARAIEWGQGPSGGRKILRAQCAEATGSGKYGSHEIAWFGAARSISQAESAYAVFFEPLPEFICFGPAKSLFGPPGLMEIFSPGQISRRA